MSLRTHRALTHPRIGTFLAIYTSAIVALLVLLVILEQLGTGEARIRNVIIIAPIGLFAIIGLLAYTRSSRGFFVAERRVPAFFGGLASAVTMFGGTGLAALSGMLFLVGQDALAIGLGVLLGVMVLAMLLAPFFRKHGAFTVPEYLGHRFESPIVRLLTGLVLMVGLAALLLAELRFGLHLAAATLGQPLGLVVPAAALLLVASLVLGGMRGLTWSNSAQAIAFLLAMMAPLVIVSLQFTNLPIAPFTYGGLLEQIARQEVVLGLASRPTALFEVSLVGAHAVPLERPYLGAFANIGLLGYPFLVISIMGGIAALPSVLARMSAATSVAESRRTTGWTAAIVALIVLSLPAYAVFSRRLVLGEFAAGPLAAPPLWLAQLEELSLAHVNGGAGAPIDLARIAFSRDGTLAIIPLAAGMPVALVYFAISGLLAAAFAGASARILAIANILTQDVIFGFSSGARSAPGSLAVARVLVCLIAPFAAYFAAGITADPLRLFLLGLGFIGSATLAPLVMSIWWKRINTLGAIAGIGAGALFAGGYIVLGESGALPPPLSLDLVLVGALGIPVSAGFAALASLLGAKPGLKARDLVLEMRLPSGETIRDREERLAPSRRRSGRAT